MDGQLEAGFWGYITPADAKAGARYACNSATAGSIVGAAVGYDGMDPRWVTPLNDTVKTVVADFGEGKISDLVGRTIAFHRRM